MAGTRRGRAAASWQGAVAASSGAAGDDGGAPCAMFEWGKRGNVMLPAIKTQRLRMLLEHYLEVRGTRRMPSRGDIDALRLGPALPIIWMSEYEPAAGTFRYRLAGEAVNEIWGFSRSEEHTSELPSLMRNSYH